MSQEKVIAYRELYAPAHFGNSYMEMGLAEATEILAEARWWGFNAYGDWFDFADMLPPNPELVNLSRVLFEKQMDVFAIAASAGLELNLMITPNQAYANQASPAVEAKKTDERWARNPQLVCPSNPQGRRIILDNHRKLFEALHERGVRLAFLSSFPFDPGGCSCEKCTPWILTWGRLTMEIAAMARGYFPGLQVRLVGWWWTPAEQTIFKAWADREAPGFFISNSMHIKYDQTAPEGQRDLPAGCEPHLFIHIGYPDTVKHTAKQGKTDVYGAWGPVCAPVRLPATLDNMRHGGMNGFVAYSEGSFDDINKALLAGISSGQFDTAEQVLAAYAQRYFGATDADAKSWAAWLTAWGRPFENDLVQARSEFDRLAKQARPSWRLDQLQAKLRIFQANAAVEQLQGWGPERLQAAQRFFAERERTYREVWKVGALVCCGLYPGYFELPWTEEWRGEVRKNPAGKVSLNEA